MKMLTLKMGNLDYDARMIVQAVCFKTLKWQKDQLEAAEKETADKEEVEMVMMTD